MPSPRDVPDRVEASSDLAEWDLLAMWSRPRRLGPSSYSVELFYGHPVSTVQSIHGRRRVLYVRDAAGVTGRAHDNIEFRCACTWAWLGWPLAAHGRLLDARNVA